jgi:hypothetical protein
MEVKATPPWKTSTISGKKLTGVLGQQSFAKTGLVAFKNSSWVSLASCAIVRGDDMHDLGIPQRKWQEGTFL